MFLLFYCGREEQFEEVVICCHRRFSLLTKVGTRSAKWVRRVNVGRTIAAWFIGVNVGVYCAGEHGAESQLGPVAAGGAGTLLAQFPPQVA